MSRLGGLTERVGSSMNPPDTFFIQCSDAHRAELWRIIRERETS